MSILWLSLTVLLGAVGRYANVAFDPDYSAQRPWRLWYDAFTTCNDQVRDDAMRFAHCGGGKRHHSGLYAESADGYTWEKPELDSGVTYIAGNASASPKLCCDIKGVCDCPADTSGAVKTNIYAASANGNTVYLDRHLGVPKTEKYKVIGEGLPGNFGANNCSATEWCNGGGICASADGLNFSVADCQWLNIENAHWDTWSTCFWDKASGRFLANMRSSDVYNACGDRFYPTCIGSKVPGCDTAACVHATRDVSRIESNGSLWRTLGEVAGGSTPMLRSRDGGAQLYELVGFPYYGVYLAILDVYYAAGARQEVHCELAWSRDFREWHRIEEGRDLVPLGKEGSFESHICYGSVPIEHDGNIREYYFGGDGPHFGARNSSLALITFREFGLAGVGAPWDWHSPVSGRTIPLTITGPTLVVTADTATIPGGGENVDGSRTLANVGTLDVSVHVSGEADPIRCNKLTGKNISNMPMQGCTLSEHLGKTAVLEIFVDGSAMLYMIGFTKH